jgi:CubicO group peptidase (beta-lactamase class C family)
VTSIRPGAEMDPREVGVEPAGVVQIWQAVERLYRTGIHPAIQLCVRRRGRVLLDRAIGHARGNGPEDPPDAEKVLVTPDTPFSILSASKAVTAMLVHLLDQQNLIRVDDPICQYIPEFGVHGKQWITIRHVLIHRAGIPNPPADAMDLTLLDQPEEILRVLCDQKPTWRPGRQLAYHAITGGFLLAEVVRRVTGTNIRTYLDESIRRPLGLRRLSYGVSRDEIGEVAVNYLTGPPPLPPASWLLQRALGVDFYEAIEKTNDPRFLTGVFPSANIVADANDVCRFFQLLLNGGELDGVRVFEPATVRRATLEQSYLELDLTLFLPFRYSMGFMLGADWFSLFGPYARQAFGHIGFTNVIAWADPEREIAVSLNTNGKPLIYPELYYLLEVLRQIGLVCGKEGARG